MGFISFLNDHRLISKYSKVLDWFLNDNRLSLLDSAQKTRLIRLIKKYKGFSKDNFLHLSSKEIASFNTTNFKTFFLFSGWICESELVLKHIRNCIAHGHIEIIYHKKTFLLKGVDCVGNKITANFIMPLAFLNKIYNDYLQILNKEK